VIVKIEGSTAPDMARWPAVNPRRTFKILMILHMPWTRDLGGSRVQFELAEEFRKQGHIVDKFDINDAFPRSNRLTVRFHAAVFHHRAARFVQKHGNSYDIIDSHQENLPFSKKHLHFHGLLSVRSVGLVHLYDRYLQQVAQSPVRRRRGKRAMGGRLVRWVVRTLADPVKNAEKSFAEADCIIVNNQDEYDYVRQSLGYQNKLVQLPFGLTDLRLQAFQSNAKNPQQRLASRQVVFIGYWSPRKGSGDWARIIAGVRAQVTGTRFLFLGTGRTADDILQELGLSSNEWLTIVPHYTSEQLPMLLGEGTVGAFPTYIEGFPFALLEKLASGLPTVSYDVPGPRETLPLVDASLMVPTGNVEHFITRLVQLLRVDEAEYFHLSQRCRDVARMFTWPKIAAETLDVYSKFLDVLMTESC